MRAAYAALGVVGAMFGLAVMGGSAGATTVQVEAESGCTGGTVDTVVGGYSGSGYMTRSAPDNVDCYITLPAGETSSNLSLRVYSNGAEPLNVRVIRNGVIKDTSAPALSGWTTIGSPHALEAGSGTATFSVSVTNSGQALRLDWLRIDGAPVPTTTTVPATTTTTIPPGPPPYETTEGDVQIAGLVVGLAAGSIVGGVLFANTWKDDQP